MADITAILFLADVTYTRRRAALDLVLQAGPRAVSEESVRALADTEQALHLLERRAHRRRAGIRSEAAPILASHAAVEVHPRIGMRIVQEDVGIALVVAQQHVVARPVRLDEIVLQQQRLGLGACHADLDVRHPADQGLGLGVMRSAAEIARHPRLQRPRLADVEDLAIRRQHAVHAGLARQALDEFAGIEARIGGNAHHDHSELARGQLE